ncbi:hypothetical protein BDZ97DRAFT_1806030, partial [Flammula alnicola]
MFYIYLSTSILHVLRLFYICSSSFISLFLPSVVCSTCSVDLYPPIPSQMLLSLTPNAHPLPPNPIFLFAFSDILLDS